MQAASKNSGVHYIVNGTEIVAVWHRLGTWEDVMGHPAPKGHPYATRRGAERAMKRAKLALLAETQSLFAAPEMLKRRTK